MRAVKFFGIEGDEGGVALREEGHREDTLSRWTQRIFTDKITSAAAHAYFNKP